MLPPLESCEKREPVCHSLKATEYTQKSDITRRTAMVYSSPLGGGELSHLARAGQERPLLEPLL